MDAHRFDRIAKVVAGGLSRRHLLRFLTAGILGAIAGSRHPIHDEVRAQEECPPCTVPGPCGCVLAPEGTRCTSREFPCQIGTCSTTGFCRQVQAISLPAGTPCRQYQAPCIVGTCNATGSCVNPVPIAAGTPCRDLRDPCIQGTCSPVGGCTPTSQDPVGTPCAPFSPGDVTQCTLGTCQATGRCLGTGAVVCPPCDTCHQAGVCNPNTGTCSYQSVVDGTPCETGNLCTTDTCRGGVCREGEVSVVCTSTDPCRVSSCNPDTGACQDSDAPDGTPCDDGDLCTLVDACESGRCVGRNPVVCPAPDPCHPTTSCDPATGTCTAPPAPTQSCKGGRAKLEPCLCAGTCCTPGKLCVRRGGERRCVARGKGKPKAEKRSQPSNRQRRRR